MVSLAPAQALRRLSSLPLPEAAGWLAGKWLRFRPLVPGIAGGVGLPLASGEIAGHVFGHGLTPWVALGVASVLAYVLDRQIPLPPGRQPLCATRASARKSGSTRCGTA